MKKGKAMSLPLNRFDKNGADEWNRTITSLSSQASETCASTSSATSARAKGKCQYTICRVKVQTHLCYH